MQTSTPIMAPGAWLRARRGRAFIHACADQPLTVALIAEAAGLTPWHFIRVFRQAFGLTPGQYLTRVRLERARHLLASGRSVTETCYEVGFSSLGSFSDRFRQATGAPPGRWQRQVRTVAAVPCDIEKPLIPCCFLARFTPRPGDR